ncbi:MAG TPA: gluconate 2-dehydrogenase subunit 3 family protein [Xanthobacteraceae bacterium]|jgi:gluconate 2-dehydrogenase gamma chain|nr:gluconate 2-dehydrogenase subunit 3 family protein [Xanthobacteraceae bacterium]
MSQHDDGRHDGARRAFLVGALAGAGAALATDAQAQTPALQNPPQAAAPTGAKSNGDERGAFFNPDDAATVAAFAERLMPGAPGKPGANDADVLNYIDLALAGAYADQQDFYRRGLAQLDAYCQAALGKPFARLGAAQQDELITALEQGKASGFSWPSAQAFFNTLRTHTMEGMFADPVYGGNKDFAGWRLVGFPGAQPVFTKADMESRAAFGRVAMTSLKARA